MRETEDVQPQRLTLREPRHVAHVPLGLGLALPSVCPACIDTTDACDLCRICRAL